MAVNNKSYNVSFRVPALPYPPIEYEQRSFEQFNSILRLYFNQLDTAIRVANTTDQAEATGWFMS
jgi:hypothetical protein